MDLHSILTKKMHYKLQSIFIQIKIRLDFLGLFVVLLNRIT